MIDVETDISLKNYTTLGVGGPAKFFTRVKTSAEALEAIEFARLKKLPIFVLGGGSNVLISDKGFEGLVIHNKIEKIRSKQIGKNVTVTAGGGENWDKFVKYCVNNNWAGIECLSGIPGTIGAAPVQNIGAYGQSVDQVIKTVRAIDINSGKKIKFTNIDCGFSYRNSIFKKKRDKYIIFEVEFKLKANLKPVISYHDLKTRLSKFKNPTLKQVRNEVIKIRAGKGYLVGRGYKSYQSAGSFFKNPIVTRQQFEKNIRNIVRRKINKHKKPICADPWFWQVDARHIKISAACLIQSAGYEKGYIKGTAGISPKHSLSIINLGKAQAQDIMGLASAIQSSVEKKFKVILEPEVRYLSF